MRGGSSSRTSLKMWTWSSAGSFSNRFFLCRSLSLACDGVEMVVRIMLGESGLGNQMM